MSTDDVASPMFPLGTVLFPGVGLPLRVFEPRYQVMAQRCIEEDLPFGVVLIERGSEVGGDDTRSMIGTLARIVDHHRFDDGRFSLVTVGTERIRVREWVDDDPYPRATIEPWPDLEEPEFDVGAALDAVLPGLRSLLAVSAEFGRPTAPATVELADEPALALNQACTIVPAGPFDRQRLLAADGASARIGLLNDVIAEQRAMIDAQLPGDES